MVPNNWWNIANVKEGSRWNSLTLFLKDVYTILNKGIIFQDNVRGALLDVTFSAADTDTRVTHGLSYKPENYVVFSRSASGLGVYDGVAAADQTYIYLRASATGTARIFIF